MARGSDSAPGRGRTVMVAFHDEIAGGAILSVLRLVRPLEERGWRFVFWAPKPSPLADQLAAEGRAVRGAPRPLAFSLAALRLPPGPRARIAAAPGYLRAFRAAVRELRPDLVHANSFPTFAEARAARRLGTPTVIHVHEILPSGAKGSVAALLVECSATVQVAVSRAVASHMRGEPLVVHEGAEIPESVPGRGRRSGPPVVGTVGVVSRRKGSDLFVEAAGIVRARRPEIRFEMVGAATEPLDAEWAEGVLRRAAEVGVEHIPSADVPARLAGWDLFALPSRRDPCPISVLEAMGSGLPVVGTRVDGIPEELAGDAGVLVEPENPNALAEAIEALADDGDRRAELGRNARRRVEERFSIERQAEGIEGAYLAALGQRTAPGRPQRGRAAGSRRALICFHEETLGGATLAVLRLVPLLAERGWELSFWASRPSPLFAELQARGLDVRGARRTVSYSLAGLRLPPGPRARLAALPAYRRAFREALDELRPGLVHANSVLSLPEAGIAHRAGIPSVLHVHEMLGEGPKDRLAARLARRSADDVIAVSEACAAALARLGSAASVVRGGVPLDEFQPGHGPADPPVVGFVGAISRRKGADLFVAAARLAGEAKPGLRFAMVGAASDPLDADWARGVIAEAQAAGIEYAERADVAALLREWSLVVVPSRADPFPNVVLEAMACGVPVIGSRVDGIPEQLGDETGVLVDPGNPAALAAAIAELEGDAARRLVMGEAGRRRAEREFTLERQADGVERSWRRATGMEVAAFAA